MTQEDKIRLLEETLELDEGELTPAMVLSDVADYDSLSRLSVMVMLDDEFGVKLPGEEIAKFKTVADILSRMERA